MNASLTLAILFLSIALQFAAAVLALRLIRITGRTTAWTLIATAIVLMTVRQCITLLALLEGTPVRTADLWTEPVALLTSILMITGVANIGPIFRANKQAEDVLAESAEIFQRTFDAIPDPAILWKRHLDGHVTMERVNSAARILSEGKIETYLEQRITADEFFSHTPEVAERIRAAFEQEAPRRVEVSCYPMRTIDAERWLAADYARVSNDYVLNIIRDVTEQRQTEEALRESEERFRTLATMAPVGIYFTDADGHCAYVNPRWCEMAGISPEEARGDGWVQGLHPADREQVGAAWYDLPAFRGNWGVEYRFYNARENRTTWVLGYASPLHDDDGQVTGYVGANVDITGRKRAEAALEAAQSYAHNLINSSIDMIIAVDMDRRIVEFNRAAQETYGYRREEILGQHVDVLYADPVEGHTFHRMTVEMGRCVQEITCRRKNGEMFLSLISASVLTDADGVATGVMGVSRDVTLRRRADEMLNMYAQQQQAIAQLERRALDGGDLDDLFQETTALIAGTLDTPYCKVMELLPDGSTLRLRAGVGWREGVVGQAVVSADSDSQAGFTLLAHEPVIVEDLRTETRFSGPPLLHEHGVVSGVSVAIAGGEQPFGILGVHTRQKRHFTWDDVRFVQVIADVLAQAIERKHAEETLRWRNQELALLNQSGQTMISTLDPDQVFNTILEETRRLLDVTACSIWLIVPKTGALICQMATGPQNDLVRGWRLSPGEGVAGWVAQHGESLIVPDVSKDARYFPDVDQRTGLNLRSILSVPLKIKGTVIGVIQAVDQRVNRYRATDQELLESLATTATIAIENAQLYEQARRDAETKATLLREVNHRVKNNLAAIVGLLYAEQRHAGVGDEPIYQNIIQDLINRVQGLSTVHNMLSESEWSPLLLNDLVCEVIHSSLELLPARKSVTVDIAPSPILVTPEQAHHLALVINELTTNTVRHALSDQTVAHITVRISGESAGGEEENLIQLEFQDNGPGYPPDVLQGGRHNVGFDLIENIVRRSLRGDLTLHGGDGAMVVIRFPAQ
jgi:PAS domain S-box-containing protein